MLFVTRAEAHVTRTAIVDADGPHTYQELLDTSARIATALLAGAAQLDEARVAFFVTPGFDYSAVQWGIWRAGGVAVPLALSHPAAELAYVLQDAEAAIVVCEPGAVERLRPLATAVGARVLTTSQARSSAIAPLPAVVPESRAMIIYTSGTTGKPKGVVITHANLESQIASLVEAWAWTAGDRVLLVLPLHHVHGIVNVVACALWVGATCEMLPKFDAEESWTRIASGCLTLFMAVPTTYRRLISAWEAVSSVRQHQLTDACRKLRLMVSGSAALPVQTLERWREVSGHTLLERYGMTELGMALSNPLHGERRPGCVGVPLPGVAVRLTDETGAESPAGQPGEIEVRGPNLFLEYWRRPDATAAAFRNGWFRTGDTAVVEDSYYRILGRTSIDIIKTGGFKVSALEIEEELRNHPAIAECAVLGIQDPEWGERIVVAIELARGEALELDALQQWARERLAPYKVPKSLVCLAALPRNAMGKVMKPEVAKLF